MELTSNVHLASRVSYKLSSNKTILVALLLFEAKLGSELAGIVAVCLSGCMGRGAWRGKGSDQGERYVSCSEVLSWQLGKPVGKASAFALCLSSTTLRGARQWSDNRTMVATGFK